MQVCKIGLSLVSLTVLAVTGCTKAQSSKVQGVGQCVAWESKYMQTIGDIPVFSTQDDLTANFEANYIGANIPVIRDLTEVVSGHGKVQVMRIMVRGGTLADSKQYWWTIATNLAPRSGQNCSALKCDKFETKACDSTGCKCVDTGKAL